MLIIRAIEPRDAKDIHEIRTLPGVMESTYGLQSNKLIKVEESCRDTDPDNHVMVAVLDEKVVGIAGLHAMKHPRRRHCGWIGISVHTAYQGKGIGKKLMETLMDIADNYLCLVRIDLTVFSDNEQAINMYKNFGFVVEGEQKYAAIKNGEYAHQLIMARYKKGREEKEYVQEM
jgi:putative acetyltransferase